MRFGSRLGCHQRADRSFSIKGYQFPVCARCTGVIIGELAALFILLFGLRVHIIQGLLLVFPLAVDGGLQYIKVLSSTNLRRVTTGLLAGFGLTYVYFHIISCFIELFTLGISFIV